MKNPISNLENYTIKPKSSSEDPEQRCRFYFLAGENMWKEFDVEGHYDLESAFELAKNILADDVIQMALKESIKSLDIKSKNFHFKRDGETEDLRDYTFDKDILDKDSDLFKAFKKLLVNNWNEDISWYYFRANAAKNANIHDDNDKKTLYSHYFDELKEFNDRISFLEYYGSVNVDWIETEGNRYILYSLDQCGDYHCIDNTITRDDLYQFLIGNNIRVSKDILLNNAYTWAAFAYYYGKNNGLSDIESISFADTLIMILTEDSDEGYYFLPDQFKKNIEIDKYIKDNEFYSIFQSILSTNICGDERNHIKEIFMTIFDFYKNHIHKFEYKTKRLEFRVSQRQYDQFMALPGKSKADKLDALMEYPKDEIAYSVLPDISFDEESKKNLIKNNKFGYIALYLEEEMDWCEVIKPSLEKKHGEDMEIIHFNSEWGCSSPKEEYYINNEGFDEVVDMSTARTEKEMMSFYHCCCGAPTPKEFANGSFYPWEEDEQLNKELEKEIYEEYALYQKEEDEQFNKELEAEMAKKFDKEMMKSKNKN